MNIIQKRLGALRERMRANGVDMYLIESEDFHGSEYVGDYFRCRAFISGFDGSAGTVIVTQTEAGLWTDGRYFLQAEEQLRGTGITLFKMREEGVPTVQEYIADHVGEGETLGFDGRTVNARDGAYYKKVLAGKGAKVNPALDLVGEIWEERPALAKEAAWLLDIRYCGKARSEKIEEIRKAVAGEGADTLLLTSLDDIAWLMNFRGNDIEDNPVVMAYLLMDQKRVQLFVDADKFTGEDRKAIEADGVSFLPYDDFYKALAGMPAESVILYDGTSTNFAAVSALPEQVKKIDRPNPTLLPKSIKNAVELAGMRKAHIKDGVALTKFMYWLKEEAGEDKGTEISLAEKMESFRKMQEGYIEPSFEPISGFGVHGAIIHYSPSPETDARVCGNGLLLMDTGAQFMEGTTDITRTFVIGKATDEEKKYFTQVLRGYLNLSGAKFLHGCRGLNLDYLAREPLWQMGMDYNHGTGHGVGCLLNVHEGPNGFRWREIPGRNEGCILEEGMVTSNEPGIYLEGKFGIRHESLMACLKAEKNAYGQFMVFDVLTMVPFDLDGVDPSLMTEREKYLLNSYHEKVYETIGPHLTEKERQWLKKATRVI